MTTGAETPGGMGLVKIWLAGRTGTTGVCDRSTPLDFSSQKTTQQGIPEEGASERGGHRPKKLTLLEQSASVWKVRGLT